VRVINAGVIDSQTTYMMSLSRCGVQDHISGVKLHRRSKRYVTAGMSSFACGPTNCYAYDNAYRKIL